MRPAPLIHLQNPRCTAEVQTFTRGQLTAFRDAAKALLDGEVLPPKPAYGICHNLVDLTEDSDAYNAISLIAEDWPHALRDAWDGGVVQAYFIPHDRFFGLWEGPNLEYRLDFLRHFVQRLDDVL